MNLLNFWLPNTVYPANSFVLDGQGDIQFTSAGGTSGASAPAWTTTSTADNTVTWAFYGFGGRAFELQRAHTPLGPYNETLNDAVSYSRGLVGGMYPDAGKFVLLNEHGMLDPSMGGGGGGGSFSAITSGDNVTATMTVDTGASLSYANSGVVNANEVGSINVSGNLPTHAGEILVSQPGNTAAVWADPQVQGLYAAGSSIASPPAYAAPTTIQPVLVGAADPSGNLQDMHVDASGNLFITVANPTLAVTQSGAWTVGISASQTIAVTNAGVFAVQDSAAEGSLATLAGTVSGGAVTVAGSVAVTGVIGVVEVSATSAANSSGNPIYVEAVSGSTVAVSSVAGVVEVGPTSAANTKANPFFFALSDGTNVITAALSAWGTAPTGTYVQGVNAELFVGSAAVSATAPVPVSATAAANSSGNPIYVTSPAEGATGVMAPSSAIEIGSIDLSGKLQGASASNPVPVTITSGGGVSIGGVTLNPNATAVLLSAPVSITSSGNTTLVAHSGVLTTRIYKLILIMAGATFVTLQNSTPTTLFPSTYWTPYSQFTLAYDTTPWFTLAAGLDFVLNSSQAVPITGIVYYTQM